ncbi:MAG: BatA domain-containing protein, partial [Gemmatimonas sp.]
MTFLAPSMLLVAVLGSLVAIALHFLSVRRPPAMILPTARFVAPRDVRAVSRSARPSDLLLLLLRVLAMWCAAIALAGPRYTAGARVV